MIKTSWIVRLAAAASAVCFFVAPARSFELPAFHISFVKDGARRITIEDMTEKECIARAKTFKAKAKAVCFFDPGEREIS